MIKLLPIKGFPGYRVDCKNHQTYSFRSGTIVMLKAHKPYDERGLKRNGETFLITQTRLEYCAMNGVDPTKIPKGVCIVRDENGQPVLTDRYEIARKSARTRKLNGQTIDDLEKVLTSAKAWQSGNKTPYTIMVNDMAHQTGRFFRERHHRSELVIEEAVDMAITSMLDKMEAGILTNDPCKFTMSYIYAHMTHIRCKKREFKDNMNPIIIE